MKKFMVLTVLALACSVYAETFRVEGENLAVQQGKVEIGKHATAYSNGKVALLRSGNTEVAGNYTLEKAGKYEVWVHTFSQGGNWRKGVLSINGKSLGSFGDAPSAEGNTPHFYWAKLSPVEIPAGKVEFKVVSAKGYCRVDVIVLTNDEGFTPPVNMAELATVPALPAVKVESAPAPKN